MFRRMEDGNSSSSSATMVTASGKGSMKLPTAMFTRHGDGSCKMQPLPALRPGRGLGPSKVSAMEAVNKKDW